MFLENLKVSEKITKLKAQTPHTTWVGGWVGYKSSGEGNDKEPV